MRHRLLALQYCMRRRRASLGWPVVFFVLFLAGCFYRSSHEFMHDFAQLARGCQEVCLQIFSHAPFLEV